MEVICAGGLSSSNPNCPPCDMGGWWNEGNQYPFLIFLTLHAPTHTHRLIHTCAHHTTLFSTLLDTLGSAPPFSQGLCTTYKEDTIDLHEWGTETPPGATESTTQAFNGHPTKQRREERGKEEVKAEEGKVEMHNQ